ncbi:hypothetical protein U1Q18_025137, partial [Sarracenia purpurea var. burkii]
FSKTNGGRNVVSLLPFSQISYLDGGKITFKGKSQSWDRHSNERWPYGQPYLSSPQEKGKWNQTKSLWSQRAPSRKRRVEKMHNPPFGTREAGTNETQWILGGPLQKQRPSLLKRIFGGQPRRISWFSRGFGRVADLVGKDEPKGRAPWGLNGKPSRAVQLGQQTLSRAVQAWRPDRGRGSTIQSERPTWIRVQIEDRPGIQI